MTRAVFESNAHLLDRSRQRARDFAEHDPEVAATWPSDQVLARLQRLPSCIEIAAEACQAYADRPCLQGARRLTFADLWRRVERVATGLHAEGFARKDERVGIYGFAGVDWVVVDLACLYLGAVSVPVPTGGPATDLAAMIQDAGITCIACNASELGAVAPIVPHCPTLRTLIVMDAAEAHAWEQRFDRVRNLVAVRTLEYIESASPQSDATDVRDEHPSHADRLRTLVFTSGTGERPKAAMFPERVWIEYWRDPARGGLPVLPAVRLASLPLGHIAGRRQLLYSLVTGGVTYFMAGNDTSTLLADVRRVRPTVMMLVPRVSGVIYQHFLSEGLRRRGDHRSVIADMRDTFLGDRLLLLITGSAPTAPEVTAFLSECFQVPVLRGYATTEAGVLTFDERLAPGVLSFRLADVPSLGYRTTDTPYPRGELLVKTRSMVPGYYGHPVASRDLFSDDGYVRTRDIVEERGQGEIVWIDRVDDVVKLAHGEFVEISRLEALYAASSPFIRQVFLHGSSQGSAVAAAIVPDAAAMATVGATSDSAGESMKRLLIDEVARIGSEAGLRAREIPRDCLVVMEPFTPENGLLTESGKLARHRLKAAYGAMLEEMCEGRTDSSVTAAQDVTTTEAIKELVRPFVGSRWRTQELPDDIALGSHGLALDSMGLLEVLLACEAQFGVTLAVEDLRTDKDGEPTLSGLAELVRQRRLT